MKQMNPGEFRRYIENAAIGPVTFYYKDQEWYDSFGVFPEFRCAFQKISLDVNPTYLTLSGPNDTLFRLHGVEHIQLDPDAGKIVVCCKAALPDCTPQKITYTLRADIQ